MNPRGTKHTLHERSRFAGRLMEREAHAPPPRYMILYGQGDCVEDAVGDLCLKVYANTADGAWHPTGGVSLMAVGATDAHSGNWCIAAQALVRGEVPDG